MKHSIWFRICSFVLLFANICGTVCGQSPRLYANLQGLADTRINHVTFDSDNFLWVSTSLGLSRFDGMTFTNYTNDPSNTFALRDNHVTFMHEARDGSHWVGSSDGLYYFCRTENSFTRYSPDWINHTINITSIIDHPTRPNHLILSTAGYGLWSFDIESRTFDREESERITFPLNKRNIPLLATDKYNQLWIFYHSGFRVMNLETLQLVHGELKAEQENNLLVQTAANDPLRNCIYLGTPNGLYRCMLPDMRLEPINIPDLDGKNISALCLNSQGQLVVGTEGQGLFMVNPYTLETNTLNNESCPIDLAHSKIHSITYNKQRDLCLGIYQKGILIWPSQNTLFRYAAIHSDESLYNMGCVTAFASLPDGRRLYGIDGAGLILSVVQGKKTYYNTDNSALESNAIMDLLSTPDGDIYIATYLHGVYQFDIKTEKIRRVEHLESLDNTSVMTMAYDSTAHTLYLGTNGSGIVKFNTRTKEVKTISGEEGHRWVVKLFIDSHQQLWTATEGALSRFNLGQNTFNWVGRPSSVRTFGFAEDPANGSIWFATDKGLFSYDAKLDSMVLVMEEEHLRDESFMDILRSDDGRLWLSSNYGLLSYNPVDKEVTRYTDMEIAQVGSFSTRSAIRWSNGSFCFGGDNGIVSFVPEKVAAYSRPRQPINFTRLWINNEGVDYNPNLSPDKNVLDAALWKATKLTLPPTANNFSISFALQEYCDPLGISYSYMLEGFDKKWLDTHDFAATANYSSLPAGKYIFKVRAASGGADSYVVSKEIEVEVLPHWYETYWALVLYLLLIVLISLLIFYYFHRRHHEKKQMQRAEQQRQIKEAKLRMFSSVSHEIQTPITLLIAPLRQLMNRKNDNATQSTLELMYRNALRILMLVNQQLDIRKLDRGQLRLHMQELDFRQFLEEQLRFFEHIAESRQLTVSLNDNKEGHAMVWADPEQIDKVFFNLLSNAFKFTPEQGEVRVSICSETDSNECSISIYNSGSHLTEKEAAEAFSGIGLGLAKELTELHHGRLTVANTDDGIIFTVTLPMGKEHLSESELSPSQNVISSPVATSMIPTDEKPQPVISQEESSKEKQLAKALTDELNRKKQLQERRTKLGFDYSQVQISSADQKLLDRVVEVIRQNIGNSEFNVENLGEEIGISRVHLNRKLKELIDTTPSALIKSTRLKQAAFMLAQTNMTVSEIAYSVGFSSPAYFTTNFTQYFGMSPKEFVNTYNSNPESEQLKKLLE